jgi:uncharacterized membrane protein
MYDMIYLLTLILVIDCIYVYMMLSLNWKMLVDSIISTIVFDVVIEFIVDKFELEFCG